MVYFLLQNLNSKLKKEKDECDELRNMLSEESKDDEKQNRLVRELQRKMKDLQSSIDDLDNKWRTEKDKVAKLNSDIFQITAEKTKFQKLSKGLREDVDDITSKYTREKSEVERLEEELAKLRRENTDSKNVMDIDSVVSSFEEKIRRLTAECDNFEEKYKYEKREKAEFEDKFHRVKSEVSFLPKFTIDKSFFLYISSNISDLKYRGIFRDKLNIRPKIPGFFIVLGLRLYISSDISEGVLLIILQ
jgi:chromosome segregation ATPase